MFTIRHIEHRSGAEYIRQAREIDMLAAHMPTNIDDRTMWWIDVDNNVHTINDGVIYVMNENGRTVAKYILGNPDPPRIEEQQGIDESKGKNLQ